MKINSYHENLVYTSTTLSATEDSKTMLISISNYMKRSSNLESGQERVVKITNQGSP